MTESHYALTISETKTILDKMEHIAKHAQDRTIILDDCTAITNILIGAINHGIIPE